MVTVDQWPELEPFYRRLSADLELPIPFDQRRGSGDSRAFFDLGIPTGSIIDERKQGTLELLKTYRHTPSTTHWTRSSPGASGRSWPLERSRGSG